MKISPLFIGIAGAMGLAASLGGCSQHYADKNKPVCQADGDGGWEIKDPSGSVLYKTDDIQTADSEPNYEWGPVSGREELGLNVHLKNSKISWCEISDNEGTFSETYYPASPEAGQNGPS